jgi:ribulose-5-phosphate 4-epimerase/fuculose-1-phosphate aldolase
MSAPALATPIGQHAERPADERQLRIDLAAAYRLIHHFGMDDTIYTHLSLRVPGPEHHFLINPYGMTFDEITASSLVKIDLDGNPVGDSPWPVNPAGFTIHSAVHMARDDAPCVMHTHTTAGMAVAAMRRGLLPLNQMSLLFYDRVAYHDYEGAALDLDERKRIVADLGDKPAMILRHHGLLTVGRTVAEAFYYMYYLEQSCRLQIAALQTGEELVLVPDEVSRHYRRQESEFESLPKGDRMWPALLRRLDRIDPSYRA